MKAHRTLSPERERLRAVLPRGCSWFVVRTNPRCEAKATASIRGEGFTVYPPTLIREYRHHRSKRWIRREFPLFVGYLFVALGEPGEAGFLKGCDGVRDVLRGANGPVPIPASVVSKLQAAQEAGEFDHLRPETEHGFAKGDRVLIRKGRHADIVAIVSDAKGEQEIKVLVEMINSSREVRVNVDFLRHAA